MANPNPSPQTRFGAKGGNPNNLGGKTKKQRKAEYKAAKIAAELRALALSDMLEKVKSGEMAISDVVEPNALRLFKDSEDRAHGTPKASTELTGDPNKPLQASLTIEYVSPKTD